MLVGMASLVKTGDMMDVRSETWWTDLDVEKRENGIVTELVFERDVEVDGAEEFPGEEDMEEAVIGGMAQSDGKTPEGVTEIEEVVFEGDLALGFDGADDVLLEVLDLRK